MTVSLEESTKSMLNRVTRGSVFVVAWACANIVHLLNQAAAQLDVFGWLNLGVAFWVLLAPRSAHRLAGLAAAQLLETVMFTPMAPDHQVLAAFVNACVLVAYLRRRRPADTDELVDAFAPAARVLLLVGYTAAATAKFNSDFLDTATSCAAFMAHTMSFGLIDRGSPGASLFVALTLASEAAIPVLLLLPRTRRYGVLYACSFHFLVSLSPAIAVGDFTVTLWALFLLFLAPDDAGEVGRRLHWHLVLSPRLRSMGRAPSAVLLGSAMAAVAVLYWVDSLMLFLVVWLATTMGGAWFLVTLLRVLRRPATEPVHLGRLDASQAVAVVLLAALAASPYLGLGTSSKFTMFSGVRTEGAGTNHLFLPSADLLGYQDDWMQVLEATNSRSLEHAADAGAAIPVVQLRSYLQDADVSAVLVTPDGHRVSVEAGTDHELRDPAPWWVAHTQHFRPFKVKGSDSGFCSN
jgi:hypothetical protein